MPYFETGMQMPGLYSNIIYHIRIVDACQVIGYAILKASDIKNDHCKTNWHLLMFTIFLKNEKLPTFISIFRVIKYRRVLKKTNQTCHKRKLQ